MNTDDQTRCVYLFSSNSRRLYVTDILGTLALPPNWIQHFRYARSHVDAELWDLVWRFQKDNVPHPLEGYAAIICFVDQTKAYDKRDVQKGHWEVNGLFPVRSATIASASIDGEIIHFLFSLNGHLVYNPPEERGIGVHLYHLEEALEGKEKPPTNYAIFGRKYGDNPVDQENYDASVRAFQSSVDVLSVHGMKSRTTVYTFFHGLPDTSSPSRIPVNNDIIDGVSVYKIRERGTYSIGVSIYNRDSLDETYLRDMTLRLTSDPNKISVIGSESRDISGRYDRFSFRFNVLKHRDSQWTVVSIRPHPGMLWEDANNRDVQRETLQDFAGFNWTIPILVEVSRWKKQAATFGQAFAELLVAVGAAGFVALRGANASMLALYVGAIVVTGVGVVGRVYLASRD